MVTVHIFDTFEQFLVQSHIVGMLRQDGAHLLCQCIQLVIGLSRKQVIKHCRYAVQQVIVAIGIIILVNDCIVECWLGRIIDGLLYMLVVAAYALHKRLFKVLNANLIERHRIVRCGIRLEERVLPLFIFPYTGLSHIFHLLLIYILECKITKISANRNWYVS